MMALTPDHGGGTFHCQNEAPAQSIDFSLAVPVSPFPTNASLVAGGRSFCLLDLSEFKTQFTPKDHARHCPLIHGNDRMDLHPTADPLSGKSHWLTKTHT